MCTEQNCARMCRIEMCSRQGTDLYFRRIVDSAHTPSPVAADQSSEPDAPKDILARPLSAVLGAGEPMVISCAVAGFLENDRKRRVSPELWGQIGPMGEDGRRGSRATTGGQRARTTRQSRGLSLEATRERFHRPFSLLLSHRRRILSRPCGISRSRGVAPGPPGGKSDGGVVGEETRLVGTPIHAHSLVEG